MTAHGALGSLAPLAERELRAYYAFTAAVADPERADRCRALLAAEEREREQRFRFVEDRQSYLLAHALVRSVLGQLCGAEPAALRFEAGPHGRPELCWPERAPRLRFNLSHTRGLVACAVALERDVGIDVEHIDRRVDIDQVARSVFSDAERSALGRLAQERRRLRFFELWTLKEAYIKAVGKGLALPLRAITLDLDSPRAPRIAFDAPLDDSPDAWWLDVRRQGPAHVLAMALKRSDPSPITLQEWVL